MRTPLVLLVALPLVVAGCVDVPAAVDPAATDPLSPATTELPFAFDGMFGPGVVVCPVLTCEGLDPASKRHTPLEFDGTLTGVSLTMTWDATAPTMQALRFGIAWDEEDFEYVEGPSPLVLELDDLSIDADEEAFLWTWVVTPVPMGLVHVLTPQEFHVEGNLTSVPAAAETADDEADDDDAEA